ncbi:MAG: hypothetical protein KAJ43_10720, partial [Gemmatimonadetes bacterium]|nr:hypothetical protein [Gemmatimonadota bacterium]
ADYKSYSERDWAGAERAFRRADELNPSLAMNHYHYAWYLALFGRVEEALVEHRRAAELDPLTPLHTVWIPALYWFSGDYERALSEARPLPGQYPKSATIRRVAAESAAKLGLWEEATAADEQAVALYPRWTPYLGHTYARAGRTEEALRILRELEAQPPSPWNAKGMALIHAALGNRDEALRWLAYEQPHAWLAWVATSQYADQWDSYRDDPRYRALMRKMNLRYEPGDLFPIPLPMVPPELPAPVGTG